MKKLPPSQRVSKVQCKKPSCGFQKHTHGVLLRTSGSDIYRFFLCVCTWIYCGYTEVSSLNCPRYSWCAFPCLSARDDLRAMWGDVFTCDMSRINDRDMLSHGMQELYSGYSMHQSCPMWVVWHVEESCHVRTSDVPHGSRHKSMRHVMYEWGMSCMNETCPMWVVLHANESCHVRMSQVTNQKLLKVWINVNDWKDCNFTKNKDYKQDSFFFVRTWAGGGENCG